MITATHSNKTDRLLTQVLREMREVRTLVESIPHVAHQKKSVKKLPKWLQTSLKEVEEGRTYGPFNTVKELRASLESNDE